MLRARQLDAAQIRRHQGAMIGAVEFGSAGVLQFVAATNACRNETSLDVDSWVFLLHDRNRSTKSHEASMDGLRGSCGFVDRSSVGR